MTSKSFFEVLSEIRNQFSVYNRLLHAFSLQYLLSEKNIKNRHEGVSGTI